MATSPGRRRKEEKRAGLGKEEPVGSEDILDSEDTFAAEAEADEDWDDDDQEDDDWDERPTEKDIRQTNQYLLERHQQFRRAAELVAEELAKLPEVTKVVLIGSVAVPLQKEIPRFREYRRKGIEVWHECRDVDLAVWINNLDHLKSLQRARSRALNELLEAEEIGVAHHQVELFLMEPGSNRYLGRVCPLGQCPKKGRQDCSVAGCGRKRYLKQHKDFVFRPESLAPEKSVVLFDRQHSQGQ